MVRACHALPKRECRQHLGHEDSREEPRSNVVRIRYGGRDVVRCDDPVYDYVIYLDRVDWVRKNCTGSASDVSGPTKGSLAPRGRALAPRALPWQRLILAVPGASGAATAVPAPPPNARSRGGGRGCPWRVLRKREMLGPGCSR
jgi:hypothetical protein